MDRDRLLRFSLILLLATQAAGCEVVEGIFKAGMWVGIILVVLVIGVIAWIVSRVKS
jgi:hypothetical protein